MFQIIKNNFLILLICFLSCSSSNDTLTNKVLISSNKAEIVSVKTSGNNKSYSFSVGIKSPDKGCKQYANWWEVITEEGDLIYRRILGHSHTSEQPFVRSGGKVEIAKDQIVIIRAHMNTSGYGVVAFKGSVLTGFDRFKIAEDFAKELEKIAPLPSGCAF